MVTIPRGVSLQSIASILAEKGLIEEDVRFLLLAKVSGYAGKLKAGEFRLSTGKTPFGVLRALAVAKAIQYSITIREGLRAVRLPRFSLKAAGLMRAVSPTSWSIRISSKSRTLSGSKISRVIFIRTLICSPETVGVRKRLWG